MKRLTPGFFIDSLKSIDKEKAFGGRKFNGIYISSIERGQLWGSWSKLYASLYLLNTNLYL